MGMDIPHFSFVEYHEALVKMLEILCLNCLMNK